MRLVLDTNVFISGVFFSGPPFDILNAWRTDKVGIVISSEILDEYRRVGDELAEHYPKIELVLHFLNYWSPKPGSSMCRPWMKGFVPIPMMISFSGVLWRVKQNLFAVATRRS
jgi:PIN domain